MSSSRSHTRIENPVTQVIIITGACNFEPTITLQSCTSDMNDPIAECRIAGVPGTFRRVVNYQDPHPRSLLPGFYEYPIILAILPTVLRDIQLSWPTIHHVLRFMSFLSSLLPVPKAPKSSPVASYQTSRSGGPKN